MMKWDMGIATNFVRVYPDVENGWQPPNGRDYLEWSLWGSNSPAENSIAWTLLWDPTKGSGTSVNDLKVTGVNGLALSAKIYRYGTNLDVGTRSGEEYSDAFTIDFNLAESYRYFGIRASTIAINENDPDPEINAVATKPAKIEVPFDIKPQSCRNPLNINDKGFLPVAILGTSSFDVTRVDVSSVKFEGVSPLRSALENVATPFVPFTGKKDAFDCTDKGPDGFIDLTLKFDNQAVVAALGTVTDGEVRVLHLTGNLLPAFGGTPIIGEDVVVILKKK